MKEYLDDIIDTIEGYPVKDLRWLSTDNIFVGRVKCPLLGKESLHEGYVSCTWRKNGSCLKEKNRPDLRLKINF